MKESVSKRKKSNNDSVTREISRSQIKLNPYNPKKHTDEQVKQQVKNIKRNGYLGGIVWNEASGNLIDGHRRIQALDIINKYDGTNDYTVKVEVVRFDDKTEKEQMTYMAIGNSKADYNLVAQYYDQIDTSLIGVSDEDIAALQSLWDNLNPAEPITDLGDDFYTPVYDLEKEEQSFDDIKQQREEQTHESAEDIKAKKQRQMDIANNRNANSSTYIMLKFDTAAEMQDFCDAFGLVYENDMIINGTELLSKI